MTDSKPQLHVNVDHVATIRQARRTIEPTPLAAVKMLDAVNLNGTKVAGITTHLREDRRHIIDSDIEEIDAYLRDSSMGLTFEMAATEEIRAICLKTKAKLATLVPEKREEVTTEGGLDLISQKEYLREFIKPIQNNGTMVSFFVDPSNEQINIAKELGAEFIELHTGTYANKFIEAGASSAEEELERLKRAAIYAQSLGLRTNLGHGLSVENLPDILSIPNIQELHIGHSLIANSIYYGIEESASRFLRVIELAQVAKV